MKRSVKPLAFLDRFYKKCACSAKNHPSGWKKAKKINQKATRRMLEVMMKTESEGKKNENTTM